MSIDEEFIDVNEEVIDLNIWKLLTSMMRLEFPFD